MIKTKKGLVEVTLEEQRRLLKRQRRNSITKVISGSIDTLLLAAAATFGSYEIQRKQVETYNKENSTPAKEQKVDYAPLFIDLGIISFGLVYVLGKVDDAREAEKELKSLGYN